MPSTQRRHCPDLIGELLDRPQRFEFFQAVRLLERWLTQAGHAGSDILPGPLRFRNSLSLSFPPSEIECVSVSDLAGDLLGAAVPPRAPAEAPTIELTPAFIGLLGVCGTLPFVYTEHIAELEAAQRSFAARRFLDLFSHRAVALLYAGWQKGRLHLQQPSGRRKGLLPIALSLAGFGTGHLKDRLKSHDVPSAGASEVGGSANIDDQMLAFYCGVIQQRVRSAAPLAQLLSAHFGVRVRVEELVGRWYSLPERAQTQLAEHNCALGAGAFVGARVWQRGLCVRIVLGPLAADRFRQFLPGAGAAVALRRLLTTLCGVSFDVDVHLLLAASAVAELPLDSARPAHVARLGRDTYLLSRPQPIDRCDVRYDLLAPTSTPVKGPRDDESRRTHL